MALLIGGCGQPGVSDSKVQEEQQVLFSSIPEHGVKDMVRWFIFVIRVRPKLLHGIQVCVLSPPLSLSLFYYHIHVHN